MRRFLFTAWVLVVLSGCSYVLPSSWQSFRTDPDDAVPAITRALDAQQFPVETWDQEKHKIVTGWLVVRSGVDTLRERYILTWEREPRDGTLTIYVRHEAQDQDQDAGQVTWASVYHDTQKERALLESVSEELGALRR